MWHDCAGKLGLDTEQMDYKINTAKSEQPHQPCVQTPHAPGTRPDKLPDQSEPPLPQEIGGPAGLEPTRYGDWEKHGRCTDF